VQTVKITERVKKYADGIKKLKEATEEGKSSIFSIVSYICDGNVDETMEICGALCFMSGEEFANLEPDENGDNDGIYALAEITRSKRCLSFFTTLLQIQKFTERL
jgi:hypothetical protein